MSEKIDVRTSLAVSNGAICVADFGSLASPQGVPLALDKGNNQIVVLVPSRCCNHSATRAVPETFESDDDSLGLEFNTAEHAITTAGCKLKMANGTSADALTALLQVAPNLSLTYGQIIALGGDFYGDPDHPVCNAGNLDQQIAQFGKNFASLQSAAGEVKRILQIADQYEFRPIAERVQKNQPPSGIYASLPTSGGHVVPDEDRAFDEATGGTALKNGRYLNLASTNLDHFGVDAMMCYNAGHILAQRHASRANGDQRELQIAYAINAFADHFLTDLYAAGHMRMPRRKTYELAWTDLTRAAAGLCAKGMHDEDNKFGLWVENEAGDKWVAYGDARYRDWCNAANRKVMKAAIQQSMDDVWHAFQTRQVGDSSQVFRYLPKIIKEIGHSPTAEAHRDDRRNWAPLFWWNPAQDNVWRRESVSDVSDRRFGEYSAINPFKWGLSSTAVQLQARKGPYMPEAQYRDSRYPYPPDEKGPSGEIGWPAGPTGIVGYSRVRGATGHHLLSPPAIVWGIDGTPGPKN
jgi:hypothetical protein